MNIVTYFALLCLGTSIEKSYLLMQVHSGLKDGPNKSVYKAQKLFGSNILDQIKVHLLCAAASVYQLYEHYTYDRFLLCLKLL